MHPDTLGLPNACVKVGRSDLLLGLNLSQDINLLQFIHIACL